MSSKRALRFLQRVMITGLVLFIIAGSLVIVQLLFQSFDPVIEVLTTWIAEANNVANTNLITGISIGMIILALLASILPLLSRKINRRQYFVAAQRGVVASLVFFFSQMLYTWAESLSRFWLIVTIVGVVVLTFIIIETLSLVMRQEEEVAFRTDIIAAIASGLVSGIIIKMIQVIAQGAA